LFGGCGRGNSTNPPTARPAPASAQTQQAANEKVLPASAAPTATTSPVPQVEADPAPSTKPLAKPERIAPTTAREAIAVIDLRKFPKLKATETYGETPMDLQYFSKSSVVAAAGYHRSELTRQGWDEIELPAMAEAANDSFSIHLLTKAGFYLQLWVSEIDKQTASIHLRNIGNVDARTFPAFPDAKEHASSQQGGAMYLTTTEIPEVTEFCRKKMLELGWKEYRATSFPSPLPIETNGSRVIPFIQNAVCYYLSVSSHAEFEDGKTIISYSPLGVLERDLPIVETAAEITFDDRNWRLEYKTEQPVSDLVQFYRTRGLDLGWKEISERTSIRDDFGRLVFAIDESLAFFTDVKTGDDKRTIVDIALVSLSKPQPAAVATASEPPSSTTPPTDRPRSKPPAETRKPVAAMNAKDLPIPRDARKLEYDATFGDIEFVSRTPLDSLTNFYRTKMAALGWKEDESAAVVEGDSVELEFAMGNMTVAVEMDADDDGNDVTLDCEGITWAGTADPAVLLAAGLPQAKSLVFLRQEVPIPDDANKVEWKGRECRFLSTMDAKSVVEYFAKELTNAGWKEDESDRFVTENLCTQLFQRGPVKFDVTIFRNRQAKGSRITVKYENDSEDPDAIVVLDGADITEPPPGSEATGILASKIPVPKGASDVKRDGDIEMIIFRSDLDVMKLAAFYRQELGKLGWKEDEEEAFLDKDLGVGAVTFAKGDEAFRIAIQDGGPKSKTRAIIQGEGIAWAGSRPTPAAVAETAPGATVMRDPLAGDKDLFADEKIETVATVLYAGKKYALKHAAAYQKEEFEQLATVIMFCDKPIPLEKLRRAIAKEDLSLFDVFEFEIPTYFEMTLTGDYTSITCFVEGASLNLTSDEIKATAVTRNGRVRGKVQLPKPKEFFGKPFRFDAAFDLELLRAEAQPSSPAAGELTANDDHGLLLPDGVADVQRQRGPYRQSIETRIEAEINAVLAFYRSELTDRGWKENEKATKIADDSATLAFDGPSGPLTLELSKKRKDTIIKIAASDTKAAERHGMVPEPGRARLMLGNSHSKAVVISVDGKEHNVAAGLGARDPDQAIKLDLAPGKHAVLIKVPGKAAQTEEIEIGAGNTWGIIVVPTGGYFSDRVY